MSKVSERIFIVNGRCYITSVRATYTRLVENECKGPSTFILGPVSNLLPNMTVNPIETCSPRRYYQIFLPYTFSVFKWLENRAG